MMPANSPSPQPPVPRSSEARSGPDAQRIGLFGGSFDPVHNGHLALAEACREQAGLDAIWFVPTATQPHKPHGPVAGDEERVAMLRLAGVEVSMIEIERGGVSYTVDTLRSLNEAHPTVEWFLLMGADTLLDLPNWREPLEVIRLAKPLVVGRPGSANVALPELLGKVGYETIDMPPAAISSSEMRRRVAAGQSIEGLTPSAVVDFIRERGLYR